MQGGRGRFRFLPLGPPAPPVTPLKRSLREGVRHCTPSLYCTKRRHSETGDSSRARPVGDAARGESGGIGSIASGSAARRPYSNQRCGCECNEQTEGLHRGCSYLRQPLSQSALRRIASSPAGGPFGCDTICQDIRVNAQVGTRSPYSLPFVILPVPARSPFRFIRHWRRSTPNLTRRKADFTWRSHISHCKSNISPVRKNGFHRA